MRHWRVIFKHGHVVGVEPIFGEQGVDWIIVEAPDEKTARRRAMSLYCAQKKALATARKQAEGRCSCGRELAGCINPRSGGPAKTCRVCTERRKLYRASAEKRRAEGTVGRGIAERDEGARLEKAAERMRDRRAELRLETLLEVREKWLALNNRDFEIWFEREIDVLTGVRKSA